jgi:hypothetical protein
MNGLVPGALMLASMALASSAAISYFKQLRKDRADPVINPAWPSVIRPGTLHLPPIRTLGTAPASSTTQARWSASTSEIER